MSPSPTYARSLSLFNTPGTIISRIASGAPYQVSCWSHTALDSHTCIKPSFAMSEFIKNNHGKINNANAIVLIQYAIFAPFVLFVDMMYNDNKK